MGRYLASFNGASENPLKSRGMYLIVILLNMNKSTIATVR